MNEDNDILIAILAILTVPVIIFILFLPELTGPHFVNGSGSQSGYITAVEDKYSSVRVYIKTDLSSSQEDTYCVNDDALKQKLREASENKTRVTINYKSYFFGGTFSCAGQDEEVTGVK